MKKDDRFNCLQYIEVKIGSGQLLTMTCIPEKKEEVKKILEEAVCQVDQSFTGEVKNIPHGGYGMYSRYDVTQHKYAGGQFGYIEVLEIKYPPEERCGFVIHERHCGNSRFSEWDSLEKAKKAYEKHWGSGATEENLSKLEGFKRFVPCGKLTPWFYAIGNEVLIGDYTFPDGLQDDPVFRFGKKFVVSDDEGKMLSVKTCMGARFVEEKNDYAYLRDKKTYRYRIVYWDDGTTWADGGMRSNGKYPPRPLEADELWITKAMEQFISLLSGKSTEFTIPFLDGTKFMGKITPTANAKYTKEGDYFIVIHLKGEKTPQKGWVNDFVPSPKIPDIFSYITEKLQEKGKVIERFEVTEYRAEKNGKKWAGVFFNKKNPS